MSETPETSASAQASPAAAKKNSDSSTSSTPSSNTQESNGNVKAGGNTESLGEKAEEGAQEVANDVTPQDDAANTQRDAAVLMSAEIKRRQARETAMSTGLESHWEALEDAEKEYDETRANSSQDAVQFAYTTLLTPRGMGGQSRQVDTSGTSGLTMGGAIAHAADVFGHPVQRAVAGMATYTAADPITVVGAIPQSDLIDPSELKGDKK